MVTDSLPAGMVFLPPSVPAHTAYANGVITWANGITVTTGATYTIFFTATAPLSTSGTFLTNTAGVTQTTTNENTYVNNIVTQTTQIVGTPNFQLSKSDGGISAAAGGLITYTIFYTNAGTGAAFDTVLTETVPTNTTYFSGGSSGPWTFVSGNTYTYSLGIVPALPCPPPAWATSCKQGQVQFVVRVDSLVPPGTSQVCNSATIGPGNVTAGDCTPVTGTVDLRVTKTDSNAIGQPGQLLTYTIGYTNTGTKGATGVILTETLPANTTYPGNPIGGGWSLVNGVYVKSIGPLAGGGAGGQAYFVVRVDSSIPTGISSITNTVTVDYDGTSGADPTPSNNTAVEVTPLNAAPDLVVLKTDGGSAVPGDLINYTIAYSNTGSKTAVNVVLTDTIPTSVSPLVITFAGPTGASGWFQVGATNVYTYFVGTVNPGVSGTVPLNVQTNGTLPPGVVMITNTVRIGDNGANGADPDSCQQRLHAHNASDSAA